MAFAFNLIFWNMPAANNNPTGHMNMFFVGPATTSLAVFKDISAKYGWYVNAPIYIGCMCLASFLFFLPFTVYNKRKNAGR